VGTLRDRIGPVVTLGALLSIAVDFRVESGCLPVDFEVAWNRDRT
jgi:hypothetical protein